jgi:hypothetical protein
MKHLPFVALALGLSVSPGFAEAVGGPRYSMAPVEGGIMRLDGATGRMSLCSKAGDSYDCKAIEDDRSAFMDEIEALAKENADLKKQLASGGATLRIPDSKEVDKALNLMEQMLRRFQGRDNSTPQQQGGGEKL